MAIPNSLLTAIDTNSRTVAVLRAALQGNEVELLSQEYDEAQQTLDVLHHILDDKDLLSLFPDSHAHSVQDRLRRLLLKLALGCRSVPSQLILRDGQWTSLESYGGGSFADIFRGEYQGKAVAVKRLRIFQISDEATKNLLVSSLYHESLLWRHLSHGHILPFLGIAEDIFKESLCMVMPWSEHGNIRDVIHSWKENINSSIQDLFIRVHSWIREIASGLAYLHGGDVNIAHGDLRGVNILIDSDWKVRLADFGLAVFAGDGSNHYASVRGGASNWLAPELIDPEAFGQNSSRPTFASDIYSFACVCMELYTSQAPFAGWNATTVLLHILRGGRPGRPAFHQTEEMSEQLYALLQRCWDQSAQKRPSAVELGQMLQTIDLGKQRSIGFSVGKGDVQGQRYRDIPPARSRQQTLDINEQTAPLATSGSPGRIAFDQRQVTLPENIFPEQVNDAEEASTSARTRQSVVEGESKEVLLALDSFKDDIPWILKGLAEVSGLFPVIRAAIITFQVALNMEMSRRDDDMRVKYVYTEMKDMLAVLLQLRRVRDSAAIGADEMSLTERLSGICTAMTSDIRHCANICDVFAKQRELVKVLKQQEWHGKLLDIVDKFTQRRAALQYAVGVHSAQTDEERKASVDAAQLTSSSYSQRLLLASGLLESYTPPRELALARAVRDRGEQNSVRSADYFLRELLNMQDNIAEMQQPGPTPHLATTSTSDLKEEISQSCDELISKNSTLLNAKFNLLFKQLQEKAIKEEFEVHHLLLAGPHDRVRHPAMRMIWKEMGWRRNVKASHFIRAMHDLFQERRNSQLSSYDIESPGDVTAEDWTYEFLEDRWNQPILDAIDTDRSGYITIPEINQFTAACYEGWSLERWTCYWAIGWGLTVFSYCLLIQDLCSKMYSALPFLLPENRPWADDYLGEVWPFVAELTTSLKAPQLNSKTVTELTNKFAPYVEQEEQRIWSNLQIIKYNLDALDTVSAVTGTGRLENHLFPLVYLILRRDLDLFKIAQTNVVDRREFQVAVNSLQWVNTAVRSRIADIAEMYKQRSLDVTTHLSGYSGGIFASFNNSNPLWSVGILDKPQPSYAVHSQQDLLKEPPSHEFLHYPLQPSQKSFVCEEFELLEEGKATPPSTVSDYTLGNQTLHGRWTGYPYTPGSYPSNMMVSYNFNPDHPGQQTFSSVGVELERGPYELLGSWNQAIDTGRVEVSFQVVYKDWTATAYSVGNLERDGTLTVRRTWNNDVQDPLLPALDFILRQVSPDVMRFRPSPAELRSPATRPRSLWRFAIQHTVYIVRKRLWTWSYFSERRRVRRSFIRILLNSTDVKPASQRTKDEEEDLLLCRRALAPAQAFLYHSIANQMQNTRTIHHRLVCDQCDERLREYRYLCLDCIAPEQMLTDTCDTCSWECFTRTFDRVTSRRTQTHRPSHSALKMRSVVTLRDLPAVYQRARNLPGIWPEGALGASPPCSICSEPVTSVGWLCVQCIDILVCQRCESEELLSCAACHKPYVQPTWFYGQNPEITPFTCNTCQLKGITRKGFPQHIITHPLLRIEMDPQQVPAGPPDAVVVATVPNLEGRVTEMGTQLTDLTSRMSKMEETLGSMERMLRALMATLVPDHQEDNVQR
ncbi:hypothetical protein BXZ70DRAFT_943874 [Cristinia sonorae]|uniref:Protein kinase domain-containing protein n=1 Tax=Cristinia sonorae TaxID=1940300 RepID=A0A8K0ULJ1_9AGAR|nr:hypothetical protein BXZ70DRAFT_943874 [Cristinia sonorae]